MEGRGNFSEDDEERGGEWTNEKHVQYLNSIEASFVRTMLKNNGRRLHLRLDRYLLDTSDSTSDLSSSHHVIRRKKHANPPAARTIMDGRADRRTRRESSDHRHDTSQDQVVPELQKKNGDKDGREQSKA